MSTTLEICAGNSNGNIPSIPAAMGSVPSRESITVGDVGTMAQKDYEVNYKYIIFVNIFISQ